MQTFTRVIGFGDALRLEATTAPGGLNAAVKRIHNVVGPHIGTRQTFADKLYPLTDVPTDEKNRGRAWLLLTALGQDPNEWGLTDYDPPGTWDLADVREALRDSGGRGAWPSLPV